MYIYMNMYLREIKFTLTWGHTRTQPPTGVPSILFVFFFRGSAVQDQLRNVTDLAASAAAFAAIADGCLVTWGHPDFGGESDLKMEKKGFRREPIGLKAFI